MEIINKDGAELIHAEEKIQLAMHRGFYDVGIELRHIRDGKLYLQRKGGLYKTFEEYCEKRWDWDRRRAYQFIQAAEVCEKLSQMSTIVDILPDRESHVRPLLKLEDKYRAEVWQRIIDSTNANGLGITARIVEGEVERKLAELNKNWFTLDEWKVLSEPEKQKILTQFRKSDAKFNEEGGTKIEWSQYTWNPVTGCLNSCEYCYANDIANRFYPQKFIPSFHPDRLLAPQNTPLPETSRYVFVCSMADLFGDWVPKEWIEAVLSQAEKVKEWTFLFLTKNPKRYLEFEFPKNAWLGATIDSQKRVKSTLEYLLKLKHSSYKFISFEPLETEIDLQGTVKYLDWFIIGGRSQSSGLAAGQPKWEWVESLLNQARKSNCKVYFKPNLEVRPKEYPNMGKVK